MAMRLAVPFYCCLTLAFTGCTSARDEPPPTTQQIELQRYQGTWYELARLPMFFQRNCVQSEAHYGLREDGRIDVTNRCLEKDGQWNEATASPSHRWPDAQTSSGCASTTGSAAWPPA